MKLSHSYSWSKAVISLLQSVWTSISLYRARADQINQYGFAAFGLTVAPFALMSFVNLLANVVTPSYPAMFMVRTPTMEDAEREGGHFIGHVGDVELDGNVPSSPSRPVAQILWEGNLSNPVYQQPFLAFIISLIPVAIVGGLSGFKKQHSTPVQQGFTMAWLAFGAIASVNLSVIRNRKTKTDDYTSFLITMIFLGAIPAVGTMVVVGMMLQDYGICSPLP